MKIFTVGSHAAAAAHSCVAGCFPRRAIVAAAIAFPLISHAENFAAPVELPTVTIQSSPLARSADELVYPVDVLSGNALMSNQRGTIGDVLSDRPGIANSSFGPGVGRPVIRGQGGPRVMILDNGISTMDASTVSADHAVSVDPLNAEQIEIIKGPATLIYGGAASAGVVNIIDDRLPDAVTPGLRVQGDLAYGTNADEKKAALKTHYGYRQMQFSANYSLRKAGDFSVPGYAVRHGGDPHAGHHHEAEEPVFGIIENSSLRTKNYGVSGAWSGSRGILGAAVSHFESNYGVPGHSHEDEHEGSADADEEAHGHEGVHIALKQTRFDLRALLNAPRKEFDHLETRIGINDYEHKEIAPDGDAHTTFKVKELDGRLQLKHKPVSGWIGITGLHLGHRDFKAAGEESAFAPPVTTRSAGLFAVEKRDIGKHQLEIGARVDGVRHAPQTSDLAALSFTPYSLSAGSNFLLAEHFHLRLNAQRAQRAPTPEELYANGAHLATASFERGNQGLNVETANNFDISLGRDSGRFTWNVGAFYNRINHYVYQREVDTDGDGIADRVSESGVPEEDGELLLLDYARNNATFHGGEIAVNYKLLRAGPFKLDLHATADSVRARINDGGNLPRITPMRFGGGADLRHGAWSAGIDYLRARKQDRTTTLETPTPGYDLVSADLSYTHVRNSYKTVLYLQGRNLLDEKVRLSTSFLKDVAPQPGRSIFMAVRFEFQPSI